MRISTRHLLPFGKGKPRHFETARRIGVAARSAHTPNEIEFGAAYMIVCGIHKLIAEIKRHNLAQYHPVVAYLQRSMGAALERGRRIKKSRRQNNLRRRDLQLCGLDFGNIGWKINGADIRFAR